MIVTVEVSLRGWRPQGQALHPKDLLHNLGFSQLHLALSGSGEPWEAARVVLCQLAHKSLSAHEEPSEAYAKSIDAALLDVAGRLSALDHAKVQELCNQDCKLDLFIEAHIDQNQLDLTIPPELHAQLARLSLPLRILTDP